MLTSGRRLRLFLCAVASCLRTHSPGSGPAARLGAVAFIHRFGCSLNAHLHFHCVVIDGAFDVAAAGGVVFHAASGPDATTINQVRAQVGRRLLRGFARRGLLPRDDARAMAQWEHGGGFSVNASVRIAAADRAGSERLLRYCARPPFALERLREFDCEHLIYDPPKAPPGGSGPQCLTPLERLDRLAVPVPPPRIHRHRYFGAPARTTAHGQITRQPCASGVGRQPRFPMTADSRRWKAGPLPRRTAYGRRRELTLTAITSRSASSSNADAQP